MILVMPPITLESQTTPLKKDFKRKKKKKNHSISFELPVSLSLSLSSSNKSQNRVSLSLLSSSYNNGSYPFLFFLC
jgi:hypothetical protein